MVGEHDGPDTCASTVLFGAISLPNDRSSEDSSEKFEKVKTPIEFVSFTVETDDEDEDHANYEDMPPSKSRRQGINKAGNSVASGGSRLRGY